MTLATWTVTLTEAAGWSLNEKGQDYLADRLSDWDMAAIINDAVVDALHKLPADIRDCLDVHVKETP